MAGDFNRRDINKAIGNFPLVKLIRTPPTRGNATLDLVATNMEDMLVDSGVTDAVASEEGVASDHLTVFLSFRMPRVPQYEIEKYTYHHLTPEGSKKFEDWLTIQEEEGWEKIFNKHCTSEMVDDELHELFEQAMDLCYEKKQELKKRPSLSGWPIGSVS